MTVALSGDYGKPRPALIIQSDLFAESPSVTLLPITSEIRDAPLYRVSLRPTPENGLRPTPENGLRPTPENGLRRPSQVMVDKAHTVARDKIGSVIGHLDDDSMVAVTRSLALFLGIG